MEHEKGISPETILKNGLKASLRAESWLIKLVNKFLL